MLKRSSLVMRCLSERCLQTLRRITPLLSIYEAESFCVYDIGNGYQITVRKYHSGFLLLQMRRSQRVFHINMQNYAL